MADLIDRQAALDALMDAFCDTMIESICKDTIEALPSAQPNREYIGQIKWERDTAIQQLKELGYGFGEKIRTDVDTISRQAAIAVADSSDCVGLSVEDVKKVTDEVVKGLKRLPSVQIDREKVDSLLYNIYQLQGTNLSASGVVAKKYYIGQLYEMLYGEGEKPTWM